MRTFGALAVVLFADSLISRRLNDGLTISSLTARPLVRAYARRLERTSDGDAEHQAVREMPTRGSHEPL